MGKHLRALYIGVVLIFFWFISCTSIVPLNVTVGVA
jgi:hypothetical protein